MAHELSSDGELWAPPESLHALYAIAWACAVLRISVSRNGTASVINHVFHGAGTAFRSVMKVSVLSPDLSNNCLGRAYVLAKALRPLYDVEIVGPLLGGKLWEPLQGINEEFDVKAICTRYGDPTWPAVKEIAKAASGAILYVSKPKILSFGAGLLCCRETKMPLVLDIEDWDLGLELDRLRACTPMARAKEFLRSIVKPLDPDSILGALALEVLYKKADAITVSNRFLQRRFGGAIVWHGRDTEHLRPSVSSVESVIRKQYGVNSSAFVVMFLGTPRRHKGLECLIDAMVRLNSAVQTVLWLVGIGYDGYGKELRNFAEERLRERVFITGTVDFREMSRFLEAADALVIPQLRSTASQGQMPAKVFDALSMGKPIIASDVSDLAEVVNGAGIIVPPGDAHLLSQAIKRLSESPSLRAQLGEHGRARAERYYSIDSMTSVLGPIFQRLLDGRFSDSRHSV